MKFKKISRAEALELKNIDYYTGKPCLRGHIDLRRTIDGRCRECIREDARTKYKKMAAQLKNAK